MKYAASVLLLVAMIGCDPCENEVAFEAVQSGHRAIVFERACGATVPFNTQLSVLTEREDLADEGGNIAALPGGNRIAKVVWLGPKQLLVHVRPGKPAVRQLHQSDGFAIRYVIVASNAH